MRIGIFTEMYYPYISGVVTSVSTLKNALEEKGHEVFIVTINMEKSKLEYKDNILKIPGITVGVYENIKVSSIYSIQATKIIKKWKLDIIHTNAESSIGMFSRLLSKQLNIPLVYTYHTILEELVQILPFKFLNWPLKKVAKPFTKLVCNGTVLELIVPTQKVKTFLKRKYKLDKEMHVIPTGIEIKNYNKKNFQIKEINDIKKKYGIDKDDFVLIYLGRVSKEKNIEFLIKNHSKFSNNVKLVIVGDGPHRVVLEKNARKMKNVLFLGKVEFENTPLYYQLGDVFVMSSKSETQGLTVNEALASSIPVLCIDDKSFQVSVKHGINGFIFKNSKQYIDYVNTLKNDKDLLLKMKENAEKSSLEFSKEQFADKVLKVYELAINKKKEME